MSHLPANSTPHSANVSRIKELREEHAEYIAQKREEAENAVLLMGRNAASLAAKEKERGGLVILSAQYGPASAFSSKGVADDDAVIDVTIPLQALVQNSKLYIPGGRNKFNLMGFWVSHSGASGASTVKREQSSRAACGEVRGGAAPHARSHGDCAPAGLNR